MQYGEDYHYIPVTSLLSMVGQAVLPDIYCYTIQVVNVIFIGNPSKKDGWVLVDAGMPKSAKTIIDVAEHRFGKNVKPKAIILTHGHFDHVGAIIELVEHWEVPVYAHSDEIPYLTGKKHYPEPDPSVGGGLVSRISSTFPNKSISLGDIVQALPEDGTIPSLPDWKWLHTPGHSPGHVSFFREKDRTLIAGDAFVTVKQESLYKVFTQEKEFSGPPKYFTTDWNAAWESVKKLQQLIPNIALTGHGVPVSGDELTEELTKLANHFDTLGMPSQGRYLQ